MYSHHACAAALVGALVLAAPAAAAPVPAPVTVLAVAFDEVDDLIVTGRAALDEGKLNEAEEAFAAAAAKDAERGTIWLKRLDLSRGRAEDVLGWLGAQRRAGKEGGDYTYLWGIAFATKVAQDLAAGDTSQAGFMIADAQRELEAACAADPVRYRDAHLYLARICRENGDHEGSLTAATAAAEHYPKSVEAQELIARGALGLYATVSGDEEQAERAEELMTRVHAALDSALDLMGRPRGAGEQGYAATLHALRADAFAYAGKFDEATDAYAEAVGLEPAGFDYRRAYGVLGVEKMVEALKKGRAAFAKRAAPNDARIATLDWWLGYALFDTRDPKNTDDGVEAFERAMQKWTAYTNAHYYIARLKLNAQDFDGAYAALEAHAAANRDELVALLQYDPGDAARLESLIGHYYAANHEAQLKCAFCAELQTLAYPSESRYFNNLALFLRDAADAHMGRRGRTGMTEEERAIYLPLYERSFAAYEAALGLEPQNPAFLNDGAVILHFYLEREYDRALQMYADAERLAKALLDAGEVSGSEKGIVETALRDARNNAAALRRKMERLEEEDDEGSDEDGADGR